MNLLHLLEGLEIDGEDLVKWAGLLLQKVLKQRRLSRPLRSLEQHTFRLLDKQLHKVLYPADLSCLNVLPEYGQILLISELDCQSVPALEGHEPFIHCQVEHRLHVLPRIRFEHILEQKVEFLLLVRVEVHPQRPNACEHELFKHFAFVP